MDEFVNYKELIDYRILMGCVAVGGIAAWGWFFYHDMCRTLLRLFDLDED